MRQLGKKNIIKLFFHTDASESLRLRFYAWFLKRVDGDLQEEALLELWNASKAVSRRDTLRDLRKVQTKIWGESHSRLRIGNVFVRAAAAVLLLVLVSVFAIMKYNPRPMTLFTAMKDIPQIILIGEDDFSQVITSTELDLTSHLYSRQRTYTIMTPVGKSLKVILPDSSLVWMNAQSRVDYSRTDCREISLDGEAYFQVKRDETSPFIVKVGEIDPELVTIPGILVKGIIKAGESNEY